MTNPQKFGVEQEVADFLLKHGETILFDFRERTSQKPYDLLPDFGKELFLEHYSDEAFKILRNSVLISLNLNYETLALFFNKEWVKSILGEKTFEF